MHISLTSNMNKVKRILKVYRFLRSQPELLARLRKQRKLLNTPDEYGILPMRWQPKFWTNAAYYTHIFLLKRKLLPKSSFEPVVRWILRHGYSIPKSERKRYSEQFLNYVYSGESEPMRQRRR